MLGEGQHEYDLGELWREREGSGPIQGQVGEGSTVIISCGQYSS